MGWAGAWIYIPWIITFIRDLGDCINLSWLFSNILNIILRNDSWFKIIKNIRITTSTATPDRAQGNSSHEARSSMLVCAYSFAAPGVSILPWGCRHSGWQDPESMLKIAVFKDGKSSRLKGAPKDLRDRIQVCISNYSNLHLHNTHMLAAVGRQIIWSRSLVNRK